MCLCFSYYYAMILWISSLSIYYALVAKPSRYGFSVNLLLVCNPWQAFVNYCPKAVYSCLQPRYNPASHNFNLVDTWSFQLSALSIFHGILIVGSGDCLRPKRWMKWRRKRQNLRYVNASFS